MPTPKRTDNPAKVTTMLSAECRAQIDALAKHLTTKEKRRVTQGDVIEQAVRALARREKVTG